MVKWRIALKDLLFSSSHPAQHTIYYGISEVPRLGAIMRWITAYLPTHANFSDTVNVATFTPPARAAAGAYAAWSVHLRHW